VLRCPSDKLRHNANPGYSKLYRRSYSMPTFGMSVGNWPPAETRQCGAGMLWNHDKDYTGIWDYIDPVIAGSPEPSHQTALRFAMVNEPAGTILMTERIHSNNMAGTIWEATIANANSHVADGSVRKGFYHGGIYDYLMFDGHAEILAPTKTCSNVSQQRHMWTIRAGD
jgi:hypothetical protein